MKEKQPCSVEGCERTGHSAGLCTYHYGAYRLGLIDLEGNVLVRSDCAAASPGDDGAQPGGIVDSIDLTDDGDESPGAVRSDREDDDEPRDATLTDMAIWMAITYRDTGDERYYRALAALLLD